MGEAEWADETQTRIVMDVEQVEERNRRYRELREAVKDLCWKATSCSVDDDDRIVSYIVPAGSLHRLAGLAQGGPLDGVTIAFRAERIGASAERPGGEEA